MPPELLEDLAQVAPNARIEVLYGSTEAEPIASIGAAEVLGETAAAERRGRGSCVGRPVPQIELRVAPLGARSGPPSEIGEILVAGEHVNQGYFEDPQADASNKLREGSRIWHRTGDTGYLDERGRLWLVGRVHDMVGGLHPFMVEGRVDGLSWVIRSALVALDEPVLAVCLGQGAPSGWAEELVASTGVSRVVQVDSIPLDPRHNAKIDRAALRARLQP